MFLPLNEENKEIRWNVKKIRGNRKKKTEISKIVDVDIGEYLKSWYLVAIKVRRKYVPISDRLGPLCQSLTALR